MRGHLAGGTTKGTTKGTKRGTNLAGALGTVSLAAAALLPQQPRALAAEEPASRPLPLVRFDTVARTGDGYVAALEGGGEALLTLSPHLQQAADEVFRVFQVPFAAAVVVRVNDGRVLALAGRSQEAPELDAEALALRPWAPAASIFKLVSAGALIAEGGLGPETRACYHGGLSSVLAENLIDLPTLDRRCDTLAFAVGKSQNAIIAKLASRHLSPESLERTARAFGFDEPIPFELPVVSSALDVPADPLEFARTAAGFWHTTMSPLHGALVAAAVANKGVMPPPRLVAQAIGPDGLPVEALPPTYRRVLDEETARKVGQMMEMTTTMGTARMAFQDRSGHPYLPVGVAGKTGSLAAETAYGPIAYSWFVGFAPADHPEIAFAVLLGNKPQWKIKAPYVARRLVAEYLADQGNQRVARMLARR